MSGKKEYTNGEVTVIWEPSRCYHSKNCVNNLSGVFNNEARPWINMEGGSSEDIVATVAKCPSGALSMKNIDQTPDSIKITLLKNGPLMVEGNFAVHDADGNLVDKKEKAALCRCGASNNKPYCDGTHNGIGFEG